MKDITFLIEETFYSTINPRRRPEIQDARMIQEDQHAMSNLPKDGYQREFKSRRVERAKKRSYFNDEIG